jgi:hypothetical protein
MESVAPVQGRFPLSKDVSKSNIVCNIVYDIVYDIEYNISNIIHDIDIQYRIPINMEDFGLVVSYVYIFPLFYLNCILKGYSRWNWSL